MGDERPSDAMQPSTKRRAGHQATKDDEEEEEDLSNDPGTWSAVSEDAIKARKIIKVRRGVRAEAGVSSDANKAGAPAASAASNPFAGISLSSTTNPFASLVGGGGFGAFSANKVAATSTSPEKTEAAEKTIGQEGQPEAGASGKENQADNAPRSASFASWANTTVNSSLGTGFGALASSSGGGFGSFLNAEGGFKFPLVVPSTTFGAGGSTDNESLRLFGSGEKSNSEAAPTQSKRRTGEEEEQTVFTADGVLYEFDTAGPKWRERGRGELRVNVADGGACRLLMRQAGSLRLLLNAKVTQNMPVAKMAGGVGVTFGVANAAGLSGIGPDGAEQEERGADEGDKGEAGTDAGNTSAEGGKAEGEAEEKKEIGESQEANGVEDGKKAAEAANHQCLKISTWALKIKDKEKVETLASTLERVKTSVPAVPGEAV